MKKNLKRTLAKVMAVALTVSLLGTAADADAAKKSKKPKLAKKTVTVTKGKSKKVTIKNVKKKQVKKITVKQTKKTKKIAKVTKSGKTAVKVKGVKKGTAKVTIKVTLKGKKKATSLKLTVKVKNPAKKKVTPTTAPTAAPTAVPTAPATNAPTQAPTNAPTPQVFGVSDPYVVSISDENESYATSITKRKANGVDPADSYAKDTSYGPDGVTYTSTDVDNSAAMFYIDPEVTTSTDENGATVYTAKKADLTKYKAVRFTVKDCYTETSLKILTNGSGWWSGTKLEKWEGTDHTTEGERTITFSLAGLSEDSLKEAEVIGLAWHHEVGARATLCSIELINEGAPEEQLKAPEAGKDAITKADTDQGYTFDKDNEATVKNSAWGGLSDFIAVPKDIEVKSNDEVYVKMHTEDKDGNKVVSDIQALISATDSKNDAYNNQIFGGNASAASVYQKLAKTEKAADKAAAATKAFIADNTGKEKAKLTSIAFQCANPAVDEKANKLVEGDLKVVLDEIVVRPGKSPEDPDNPDNPGAAEYKVAITAESSSIEKGETTTVEVAVVDKAGNETNATEIENVTWASTDTAKVEVESNSVDKTKVTVTGVETGSAEVIASVKTKDGKTTDVKVKITVRGVGEALPPTGGDDNPGTGEEDKTVTLTGAALGDKAKFASKVTELGNYAKIVNVDLKDVKDISTVQKIKVSYKAVMSDGTDVTETYKFQFKLGANSWATGEDAVISSAGSGGTKTAEGVVETYMNDTATALAAGKTQLLICTKEVITDSMDEANKQYNNAKAFDGTVTITKIEVSTDGTEYKDSGIQEISATAGATSANQAIALVDLSSVDLTGVKKVQVKVKTTSDVKLNAALVKAEGENFAVGKYAEDFVQGSSISITDGVATIAVPDTVVEGSKIGVAIKPQSSFFGDVEIEEIKLLTE